jgi:hypothetical protein
VGKDSKTRADFDRYLASVTRQSMAYSALLERSVQRLGRAELEDVPDLLGDAADGDFEFARFSEDGEMGFDEGVTPIAFLGTRRSEDPVLQCEGLLLARRTTRGGVEFITVEVDGTLIPGTDKVVGKGLPALGLRALVKAKAGARAATKAAAKRVARPAEKAKAQKKAQEKERAKAPEATSKANPKASSTPGSVPGPAAAAAAPSAASAAAPASDLQSFWADLDRYGAGWRRELAREMDLKQGKMPTDEQLDELLGKDEVLIYVSGGIIDLTPLRRFRALRDLGLQGHDGIENLAILRELASLRRLSLRKSKVGDLSILADLPALESLDLSQLKLSDAAVAPVSRLTRLTELDLGYNDLTTLEPLRGLVGLRRLVIFYNRITSLEPLAGMTALEVLRANDNQYADLTPLVHLERLTEAELSGPFREGKVTSLAPLSGLKALRWLNIGSQPITDLSPLAGCTALQTLKCEVQSSGLTGVDAILGLKSLREVLTHPSLLSKKDRAALKTRPRVALKLTS